MADVPVPQGERSIAPVQVDGRSQSSVPVETTTAFLASASGLRRRSGDDGDRDPGEARLLRMDDRKLGLGRGLDHLGDADDLAAFLGRRA